jgi:small subunit ribosomal protein S20
VAHHRSAKKRIRQTVKRTAINRSRMSRLKTFVRKVEDALAKGDHEAARTAFAAAEPELRRGVTKGVLHLNTASRKISRLSRRVKSLETAAPASV